MTVPCFAFLLLLNFLAFLITFSTTSLALCLQKGELNLAVSCALLRKWTS